MSSQRPAATNGTRGAPRGACRQRDDTANNRAICPCAQRPGQGAGDRHRYNFPREEEGDPVGAEDRRSCNLQWPNLRARIIHPRCQEKWSKKWKDTEVFKATAQKVGQWRAVEGHKAVPLPPALCPHTSHASSRSPSSLPSPYLPSPLPIFLLYLECR